MRRYNINNRHVPGVSKTRPNMALTVRQINERFVQGKSIPQAKAPIHEPKFETLKNPMRSPYCDLIDVHEFNNELTVQLNKQKLLLDEKTKDFIRASDDIKRAHHDSIVEEAKRKILAEKPL